MPGPFIHLAVARELATGKNLDLPQFYFGSIAPDAIHAFGNAPRPRKVLSHLLHKDEQMHESDNVKNREKVIAFLEDHRNSENMDFFLGYAVHILTDHQWAMTVYLRFLDAYTRDKEPLLGCDEAFYNDLNGLSYALYKESQWRTDTESALANSTGIDVPGLVTADEVNEWKRRSLIWFVGAEDGIKYPPKYITLSDVRTFISESVDQISKILQRSKLI